MSVLRIVRRSPDLPPQAGGAHAATSGEAYEAVGHSAGRGTGDEVVRGGTAGQRLTGVTGPASVRVSRVHRGEDPGREKADAALIAFAEFLRSKGVFFP